jgi:DNA polymerase III delta prime subunit
MIGDPSLLWVERFRPRTVQDCIIPDALKATLQQYVDKGEIPNLLLTGSAGTGKTTVARALCDQCGVDYIMINGSDENGIDTLRVKIKGFASSMSLSGGRKAIIIDEADYLTPQVQAAFRGVIEEFINNCSFIFTCNFKNRIIPPLHSRFATIDFKLNGKDKELMAAAFYKRTVQILKGEGVTFDGPVLAQVIMKFFPDYRKVLNELQQYSATGTIDAGLLSKGSDAKIDELIIHLKAKDFKSLRKWVGTNSDADSTALMRALYDKAFDIWKPETVPVVVVILGKYLFQASHVADQEINTAACLTELMVEAQVK